MKIENDKYYTPIEVANKCWDIALRVIGEENIIAEKRIFECQ